MRPPRSSPRRVRRSGGKRKLTAVPDTGRDRPDSAGCAATTSSLSSSRIARRVADKYLRKDEIPAQESGPTATGFNGDTLLQFPAPTPPPARAGGPPPPTADSDGGGRAHAARHRQAGLYAADARPVRRLVRGVSSDVFLTSGKAEAPQGKADVLDVKGPAALARWPHDSLSTTPRTCRS